MTDSLARGLRAYLFLVLLACTSVHAAQPSRPLTLRQAIDAALSGNPELRSFAFHFRAQAARIEQATLRPAPELSLQLENFAGTGDVRAADALEATLALSQVIELSDKRAARMAAAEASRGLLEAQRQASQLDVLAEVTRRFIKLAAREEHLKLARSAVELGKSAVAASEKRVNAAKSPHAELDRARIALDRARLDEQRASMAIETARRQLAAMWGESQPVIAERPFGAVQADLFTMPAIGGFAELLEQLASTPDFLLFASEARLRDTESRVAASLRKPDLQLGGGVRRLDANDYALVASVSVPLFSGRRARSLIAEAHSNRELVDAERRVADVRARAMLFELHRELERAVIEVQTLKADILPRALEALEETRYAYERGRYSYLEFIDAQREYLALQANLIEASANAHALRAEIERLINAPLAGGR